MNKVLAILICVTFVLFGCNQLNKKEVIVEDTPIDITAEIIKVIDEGGCCVKANDRCASGVGVTEMYCDKHLAGTWVAGTQCNTTTGACE